MITLEHAKSLEQELVRIRRDLHSHPELGFQEFRTAALVADTLNEIGIETRTGVGRTGVVAEIGSGDGPTIAIRADMDALPILDTKDVEYKSQNEGVMHACGHDAHTSILLGAAHLLQQDAAKGGWDGKVRFVFQPCEEAFDENGVSGATAMIDDGALEDIDAAIALHVSSMHPAGTCRFHDGLALANVDSFEAWIRGDGSHGASPHHGADPLFMLGPILTTIYAIPSRQINPTKPVVVSIGEIKAGSAPNVIPNEVYIQGTIRSYEDETREKLKEELERALALSENFGGSYELKIHSGYPALNNNAEVNDWMRTVVGDLADSDSVVEADAIMGAEDFAYMARKAPGAMFFLGAKLDEVNRPHHTDVFDIDESVLPLGAAVLAETARRFVRGEVALDKE
jgi:amidohydrolase